jgi:hypothetical protein
MRDKETHIPVIGEDEGRQHARLMYELLGHELCGITELRALGEYGPWVAFTDNAASFVDLAMERNREGDHVYVGLQPRPTAMRQPALNTWRPARGGMRGNVARAKDIEYVTNIALDIDVSTPQRAAGHPASGDELRVCVDVARRFLMAEGFAGTAAVALSGNGVYVLNPITPVHVEAGTSAGLKAMERRWITRAGPLPPGVRIDPIMDLPRIIRAIGTVNFKGTPTPDRPHRRSRFLTLPAIGGRQNLVAEQLRQASGRPVKPTAACSAAEIVHGDLEQFEACEFVGWIVRDAPGIPEPAWMDFLVQCAWLDGGDELAHRISRHDTQRYSREETQARLERIRRAGYRPKRCRHLSGENGLFECPRIYECPVRRPIDLTARKQPRSCRRPQPDTEAPHESI